jgi:hypothetical protein
MTKGLKIKSFNKVIPLFSIAVSVGSIMAGCAKPTIVDNSPERPTAVVKSEIRNFGIKGMFAYDGSQVVRTREQAQQTNEKVKFTGTVMRFLTKEQDESTISRVDKNLLWKLDNKEKRYTECPLTGCGTLPGQPSFANLNAPETGQPSAQEEEPVMEQGKPGCVTKITKNEFKVEETGQTRVINGFKTKEYQLTWQVVAEDDQHRQDTNTITINIWTTPNTNEIDKVMKVQESFQQAYMAKINQHTTAMDRIVPQQALAVLTTYFFNSMSEKDRAALLKAAQEMEKIKGYPISTKLEWNASAEACGKGQQVAQTKQEGSNIDLQNGVSGLVGSLTSKFVEKKVEDEAEKAKSKPIFGYVQQVTSIKMEMVHDSVMEIPHGYKLETRE